MHKAIAFLRAQLYGLTNPYSVAMTSYALANGNALDKQVLLGKASAGKDTAFSVRLFVREMFRRQRLLP